MTSLEVRDPRLSAVVGPDVTFEKMADGCLFTEGPLWHPRGRYLLWSDMPGDHLRRVGGDEGRGQGRARRNEARLAR
jgi:gluconolactonase